MHICIYHVCMHIYTLTLTNAHTLTTSHATSSLTLRGHRMLTKTDGNRETKMSLRSAASCGQPLQESAHTLFEDIAPMISKYSCSCPPPFVPDRDKSAKPNQSLRRSQDGFLRPKSSDIFRRAFFWKGISGAALLPLQLCSH